MQLNRLQQTGKFLGQTSGNPKFEFLDKVIASGVHTLKIEGRGRSPEYVKLVTQAYREAVDAVQAGRFNQDFVDSLLNRLKKVYNRGHSSGYYLGRPQGWSAAYGSKATHQKILCGEVTHYYPKIGVAEMPMAIIALVRDGPRNAAKAMARIRKGAAKSASVQRDIMASVQPPK